MTAKVIFLDIDGPMIPATMFLLNRMCSHERQCSPLAIAVMNRLCQNTGAKIVFNTTHNKNWDGVDSIETALVAQGLNSDHIHPTDPKTTYPFNRRDVAVTTWLAKHPEVTDWVALDDAKFTDKENLILVEPDGGLHLGHMNLACQMLGGEQYIVLI